MFEWLSPDAGKIFEKELGYLGFAEIPERGIGRECWNQANFRHRGFNLTARYFVSALSTDAETVRAVSEAALDPLAAAKLAKLRHVGDDMPGITRHKARNGFDYRLPDGDLVRDIETLKRIRSLADPAGLDGGLDLSLPQRAHPGDRARPARPQAVPLPPALARGPRRVEIRQDAGFQPGAAGDQGAGRAPI